MFLWAVVFVSCFNHRLCWHHQLASLRRCCLPPVCARRVVVLVKPALRAALHGSVRLVVMLCVLPVILLFHSGVFVRGTSHARCIHLRVGTLHHVLTIARVACLPACRPSLLGQHWRLGRAAAS
jgi:hypothetical protein